MPHPLAIASAAPGSAGRPLPCRLTPGRLIPAFTRGNDTFTSANEALARANEVTCFQRPEGTQRKELLCNLHKPKGMQNHPGGVPRGLVQQLAARRPLLNDRPNLHTLRLRGDEGRPRHRRPKANAQIPRPAKAC
jgi:hypothetical protein